jgi:hypothetical protein
MPLDAARRLHRCVASAKRSMLRLALSGSKHRSRRRISPALPQRGAARSNVEGSGSLCEPARPPVGSVMREGMTESLERWNVETLIRWSVETLERANVATCERANVVTGSVLRPGSGCCGRRGWRCQTSSSPSPAPTPRRLMKRCTVVVWIPSLRSCSIRSRSRVMSSSRLTR